MKSVFRLRLQHTHSGSERKLDLLTRRRIFGPVHLRTQIPPLAVPSPRACVSDANTLRESARSVLTGAMPASPTVRRSLEDCALSLAVAASPLASLSRQLWMSSGVRASVVDD